MGDAECLGLALPGKAKQRGRRQGLSSTSEGDVTGKWAVEEGSTHQCFCLGNWLPAAKGRNPSWCFGSAKERNSRAESRRGSWGFHPCPVAGRREEDRSAVCQGPTIAGCELWCFYWSAKPPAVLSLKLGCRTSVFLPETTCAV